MSTECKQKIKTNRNSFAKALSIIALISLLLAPLFNFVGWIFLFVDGPSFTLLQLLDILKYSFIFLLFGILPPIFLFLTSIFAKKKTFPIIFLTLSALFVFVQLLANVYNASIGHLSLPYWNIAGSNILDTLIDDCTSFFMYGHSFGFISIINRLFWHLSDLLYILPNALCFVGFAKLAFTKNKPVVEAEETAAEVCEAVEADSSFDAQPIADAPVETQPTTEENTSVKETTEQSCFCRKCGTKLLSDSEFCHKCGTEAVK